MHRIKPVRNHRGHAQSQKSARSKGKPQKTENPIFAPRQAGFFQNRGQHPPGDPVANLLTQNIGFDATGEAEKSQMAQYDHPGHGSITDQRAHRADHIDHATTSFLRLVRLEGVDECYSLWSLQITSVISCCAGPYPKIPASTPETAHAFHTASPCGS